MATWSDMGGFLANPELSDEIRRVAQPMLKWRQFVRTIEGFGKSKGDTINFDRFKNVQNPGGIINELTRMPETNIVIEKASLSVNEYGNAVPYTGKLEALSQWDADNIYMQALKDDMAKTLDLAVATVFKGTQLKYTPTGTPTVPVSVKTWGAVATAALRNIQVWDLNEIRQYFLDQLQVPPYDEEDFVLISSIGAARALRDDSLWQDTAKYGDPERLFSGEVGRIRGFRVIETNNGLSSTLGSTAFLGEAVVLADDPQVEGVAVPEELRAKIPDDYGRSKGIAWYFLGGFQRTWDPTVAPPTIQGEQRIMYVTST